MLTADLLVARIRKGKVVPGWFVRGSDDDQLVELIEIFESAVGHRREDLDEALDVLVGAGTDFLVWRGLSKLLSERMELEVASHAEPQELRRAVFEEAAGNVPATLDDRAQILARAAARFGLTVEQVETSLHADLPGRQRIVSFKSMQPDDLVNRYNVSLAQAVLYKATRMTVVFEERRGKRLNDFFRSLKFHGLMHTITRDDKGWVVEIDGPASILSGARKYGVNMAIFLPRIVALGSDTSGEIWRLNADIQWKRDKVMDFELNSGMGLVAERKVKGAWISDEEKMFESRFAQKSEPWTLHRKPEVFTLSNSSVLTTDFMMERVDGAQVFLEVVGFWRADYLKRRLELLSELKKPVILIVAERLRSETAKSATAPEGPELVYYKGVIRVEDVIEAAEALMRRA